MKPRISDTWHKDARGQTHPNSLVGKKFVHVASSTLYVVTGYRLNASNDQWAIEYDRFDEDVQLSFAFARDMAEFLDGRFIEVK